MFTRRKKSTSGFTLIELLVVIAIIGVLSSVVLASLNTARTKARDARRVTDIKQIQIALELYFDGAGNGQYPDRTSGTCSNPPTTAVTDSYGLQALVNSQYIAVIPRDPSNIATCYQYATQSGQRRYYHLGSGINLEVSGNPVLSGDRDCNSFVAGSCNGLTFTNGFPGADPIYDVTP